MKNFLKLFLVTGFFSGYLPFFPGTAGTIVGMIFVILLNPFPYFYYGFTIMVIITGLILSKWAETELHSKEKSYKSGSSILLRGIWKQKKEKDGVIDPQEVVIDEIAGVLVAMLCLPVYDLKIIVAGFVLFRIFDIIKPFPIHRLEKIRNGWGIMLDDIVAGIYTNLCIRIILIL